MLTQFAPFAKVLAAFVLMLAGMRFKLGLGNSILAGAVALGVMFGLPLADLAATAAGAVTQEKFLLLTAIVGLILVLSDAMERTGQGVRLMDALAGYLTNPRLRLIFFPALIGLLPMPGGAVFSAPMVQSVSHQMDITNRERALINYWFRHIWELCWPLYPGIILTAALADVPILSFVGRIWPGTVLAIALGWFFFLRPGVLDAGKLAGMAQTGPRSLRTVFIEGLPLIIAIVGGLGLEGLLAQLDTGIPFELGVVAALAVSVGSIMLRNRLGLAFLRDILTKKSLWLMLWVILAIFIFKDVMMAAGVVQAMAQAAGADAALWASATFLPFLVGMVSGITVAFVGATFPLVLGMLDTMGMQSQTIPWLGLALFCGFSGVMVSPIHICFVLTCQYFKVNMATCWRKLVAPSLLLAVGGLALFLALD